MRSTGDDGMMAQEGRHREPDGFTVGALMGRSACTSMGPEAGNVRFLIEQQLRLIDELDRRGLDDRAAHDLLRRLMRQDEELRCRAAAQGTLRMA